LPGAAGTLAGAAGGEPGAAVAAQDRHGEARALQAGIYNWFTEGLDAVDLIEVRALLEQLQ